MSLLSRTQMTAKTDDPARRDRPSIAPRADGWPLRASPGRNDRGDDDRDGGPRCRVEGDPRRLRSGRLNVQPPPRCACRARNGVRHDRADGLVDAPPRPQLREAPRWWARSFPRSSGSACCNWARSPGTRSSASSMPLMLPAMLLVMLWRLDEYTAPHVAAPRRRWHWFAEAR